MVRSLVSSQPSTAATIRSFVGIVDVIAHSDSAKRRTNARRLPSGNRPAVLASSREGLTRSWRRGPRNAELFASAINHGPAVSSSASRAAALAWIADLPASRRELDLAYVRTIQIRPRDVRGNDQPEGRSSSQWIA